MAISESLYLSVGGIKYRKLQQLKYRGIQEGFVLAKEMPNGLPRQFVFYHIDDEISKVNEIVSEINKYKE